MTDFIVLLPFLPPEYHLFGALPILYPTTQAPHSKRILGRPLFGEPVTILSLFSDSLSCKVSGFGEVIGFYNSALWKVGGGM